jgi:hypothetical protein
VGFFGAQKLKPTSPMQRILGPVYVELRTKDGSLE